MGRGVRLSSRLLPLIPVAAVALIALSHAGNAQLVFQPPRVSDAGGGCTDLVVGDFDGDGVASGTLVAGQPFAFKLFSGPPSGFAYHGVGLAPLFAPFKGGTLVPFPHLLNGPLPLNSQGAISLAANWPAGGSGLTLWVQFWMPNGGGPAGFVASSGVRAQIP